jgi:hypothetical protein
VQTYRKVAMRLAAFIVPMSIFAFLTTTLSQSTLKDIDAANALAVKLSDELAAQVQQAPKPGHRSDPDKLPFNVKEPDVIRDLQTFAGTTRAIELRARMMNWFVLGAIEDPVTDKGKAGAYELPPTLPNLSEALTDGITTYQQVRYFAQSVQERISTFYGAIAVAVLPVLYALLGACASLLRMYEEQVRSRTYTGSDTHVARFVIAAIGGGVVGLFKDFTPGDGASISPFAIAFLVGYAADVFFSFLDTFVQTFKGSTSSKTGR